MKESIQMKPFYRTRMMSWILFAIYFGSLFLPYRLLTSDTYSPFQIFSLDSGIKLVYPMFGLIPVVLMHILYHIPKRRLVHIWIIVLSSLTLVFLVLITLQLSVVLYLRADFQLGFYLNGTATVGYFILSIDYFRRGSDHTQQENPDLLDTSH